MTTKTQYAIKLLAGPAAATLDARRYSYRADAEQQGAWDFQLGRNPHLWTVVEVAS